MVASALTSSNTSLRLSMKLFLSMKRHSTFGIDTDGVKVDALVGNSSSRRPQCRAPATSWGLNVMDVVVDLDLTSAAGPISPDAFIGRKPNIFLSVQCQFYSGACVA